MSSGRGRAGLGLTVGAAGILVCSVHAEGGSVPLRCGSSDPAGHASRSLFEATVLEGPDALHALQGRLGFTVSSSGVVSGTLLAAGGGRRLHVTGRVDGRVIRLRLRLPGGEISGVGVAGRTIRSCGDVPSKGTLTGPRRGDTGTWATGPPAAALQPGVTPIGVGAGTNSPGTFPQ